MSGCYFRALLGRRDRLVPPRRLLEQSADDFVASGDRLFRDLVEEAGLRARRLRGGVWRGDGTAPSYLDVLVIEPCG